MNIITITYRSTNYYILDNGKIKLLIDAGLPGTLGEFRHVLQKKDIRINDINYLLITHYHPDHAGLAQDIKEAGAKLIVMEEQLAFMPLLNGYIKPGVLHKRITPVDNIVPSLTGSRGFLKTLGFDGEIIHTPGHSDDSVSLVLNTGEAFIGDLPPNHFADDTNNLVNESWVKLKRLEAKKIYHAHTNPFIL